MAVIKVSTQIFVVLSCVCVCCAVEVLVVSGADGIEPLLKLVARRDSVEMLEVVSLALANFSADNPNNCRYDISKQTM